MWVHVAARRSRESGDSFRNGRLGTVAMWLLSGLLLSSAWAEDNVFRQIARHDRRQPTVSVLQPKGACVKDTSRPCRSWHKAGTAVDHIIQCTAGSAQFQGSADVSATQATCSADTIPSATSGTCICGPDHCADTDMLCHPGSYQVINEVFTITNKAFPQEKLYMTPDGKVKVGWPPDPRAAQWRISVTGHGVKLLWTELYTNTIMQEYESCSDLTDQWGLTFTKCMRLVGHVPDPHAAEMGWYIELYGDMGMSQHLGMQTEEFLQLRSANTWDMFYISPLTKEGVACEDRGRDCPGDFGAWMFDPPLLQRVDLQIDTAPGTLPGNLASYFTTVGVAILLMFCLACAFNTAHHAKARGEMRSCLLLPCFEFAKAMGYKHGAKI